MGGTGGGAQTLSSLWEHQMMGLPELFGEKQPGLWLRCVREEISREG